MPSNRPNGPRDISLNGSSVCSPKDSAEPGPGALLAAIERRDAAAALSLLRRPRLPGLNEVDKDRMLRLHQALAQSLPKVALAILARTDFQAVNAKDVWGWTALHGAAWQGFLPVCRAIVGRADFVELWAVGRILPSRQHGLETALQMARKAGHREVVEFLEDAEAGLSLSSCFKCVSGLSAGDE